MTRVLTLGTFDLFHDGHRYLLTRGAERGELWVGVNSDRLVQDYKGKPPVRSEMTRLDDVSKHPGVAVTVLNDGPGRDVILRVAPDLIVVGGDWLEHDYLSQIATSRSDLEELGCDVLFISRLPGLSTTLLRAA